MNVRNVGVGRVEMCMLCVCDSEERELGVGTGVNGTMLSGTPCITGSEKLPEGVLSSQ